MATVLVTGVGSTGGTGALTALRERAGHEVVGVDMDPSAEGLYLADHGATVPPASAEEWPEQVADLVAEFGVDAVVPLVDEELVRLPELDDEVGDDVGIVAPRPEVVETTIDKYRMVREYPDVRTPEAVLATDVDAFEDANFPVIVKPRFGRGSRGVERFDSRSALHDHLQATDRPHDELLVQRLVEGTEYTTSVVTTRDDRLLSVVPKEAIEKDGCTVRGVTRDAPHVRASCRRVFEALSPHGPMNVQQMESEATGEVYTIEVNPRFSSTAPLTVAAGVDELDLLVRDAMGETVAPPDDYERDLHLMRYRAELFVGERDLL